MLRLTNSEMSTLRDCKRKWWLASYRGLAPRSPAHAGTPLAIGSRVHDALAAYYDPDDPQDPIEFMREQAAADVEKYPAEANQIEKDLDLCLAMVEGYLEWLAETGADSDFKIIAKESALEVPLFDDVTLLSKLDLRVERRSDGMRLAREFKTTGELKTALPLLQLDTQVLTEHLVEFLDLKARGEEEERARGIIYTMLRKVKRTAQAKPPFYAQEVVEHNIHELRNHWRHVVAQALEIKRLTEALDAGTSHHEVVPPSPTRDCTWKCEFFKVCPLFDDGSDVEAALADLYRVRDPLERYDTVQSASDVAS